MGLGTCYPALLDYHPTKCPKPHPNPSHPHTPSFVAGEYAAGDPGSLRVGCKLLSALSSGAREASRVLAALEASGALSGAITSHKAVKALQLGPVGDEENVEPPVDPKPSAKV